MRTKSLKIVGDDPNVPMLLLKDNGSSDSMYTTVPPFTVVTVNGEQSKFQNLSEKELSIPPKTGRLP
ncbi:MAG: hypothetical protein H6677_26890 [Candidatus Obscuribacterales bacterium]|nr:hypothetical protein [Cyanobacteria bacterium HKST-UBA01]MCB9471931.1 hypothetical protein [Candidatus Obscuribacterales bacterium]